MRLKGREGFDAYYTHEWQECYPSLKESLLRKRPWFLRLNQFIPTHDSLSYCEGDFLEITAKCRGYLIKEKIKLPKSDDTSLQRHYPMDMASVYPPLVLSHFFKSDTPTSCLDMCAAPGGKSLILAENLLPHGHSLTLNDQSNDRLSRLKEVCRLFIPEHYFSLLSFKNMDGRLMARFFRSHFDYILLDTPCSSEQHVLSNPKFLDQWNEIRIQRMQQTQLGLLKSAITLLKPGGIVVYSTCALNRFENDAVIHKMLTHKKVNVSLIPSPLTVGEETSYGRWLLPDRENTGPIYFSILQKESF